MSNLVKQMLKIVLVTISQLVGLAVNVLSDKIDDVED